MLFEQRLVEQYQELFKQRLEGRKRTRNYKRNEKGFSKESLSGWSWSRVLKEAKEDGCGFSCCKTVLNSHDDARNHDKRYERKQTMIVVIMITISFDDNDNRP